MILNNLKQLTRDVAWGHKNLETAVKLAAEEGKKVQSMNNFFKKNTIQVVNDAWIRGAIHTKLYSAFRKAL